MPVLSKREAAALLNISASTLDRLTRAGVVPAVTIGTRTVRYRADALAQALKPKPSTKA